MKFNPRFNPVALKELRQLVRSRVIVWGVAVFPVVLLLITSVVLAGSMHDLTPEQISLGKGFGASTLTGVSVVTGILCGIISLFAAMKTILETGKDGLGLEFTTALTPAKIVSGKITAVAIILAIAVALAMPFFVLSYLMRGIDLVTTVATPLSILLGGVAMFSVALLPSCMRRPVPLRIICLLAIFFAGPMFLSGFISFAMMMMTHGGSSAALVSSHPLGAIGAAVLVAVVIAYCRAQAAAELSPPHLDRLRQLRMTQAVLFAASIVLYFAGGDEVKAFTGIVWFALSGLVILAAACSPSPLSRGAVTSAPRSAFLRAVSFPFATGSIPSLVFAAIIAAGAVLMVAIHPDSDEDTITKILVFMFELHGTMLAAGCIARLLYDRRRRLSLAVGKLAIVYIVAANLTSILVEMNAVPRETARLLPCNIEGMSMRTAMHTAPALGIAAVAALLLLYTAARELRSYRRPK